MSPVGRAALGPVASAGATGMASASKLTATFDAFLFATVCQQRDETPLSVVSALARLDLDPWAEAAALARMPEHGAAIRLTSLLADVADAPSTEADRAAVVARLVALLPAAAKTDTNARGQAVSVLAGSQRNAARLMWLVFVAAMLANLLIGRPSAGPGASAPTPAPISSTAPSAPSH